MTNEMMEKAKACRTAEELLALAKENGIAMTAAQAEEKYAELHNEGELSEDELENTTGGGCHNSDGRLIVTVGYSCDFWKCKRCKGGHFQEPCICTDRELQNCSYCIHMSYEKGLWLCNHEAKRQ